jgi:3-deoxy-D-arabino-heptulosonate 7-phosphate (DAHP) synthase
MNKTSSSNELRIIAGPCAIDKDNIETLYDIADIKISNSSGHKQTATFGVRVVGLKSRSKIYDDNSYMGMDYESYLKNLDLLISNGDKDKMEILPSLKIANQIIKDTGMVVATELMSPMVQLPLFETHIPKNKLFIWNPCINQLGWPILEMAQYAIRNGWYLGIKNGKWLSRDSIGVSDMERNWIGNSTFAKSHLMKMKNKVVLIHRGVEVKHKGDYRSLPVHDIAIRAKSQTNLGLYFDPSHSLGSKLRDRIVDETVEVMKMRTKDGSYVYNGLLIEVGKAQTDMDQHITVREYKELAQKLSTFRDIVPADSNK